MSPVVMPGTRGTESATPSELGLVEAARQGSRSAFGALVEHYQKRVCALAYAVTGSFSQSEEIAQEAFLTAWKRLRDVGEPARFGAWLYGVTLNVSRNARRKQRAHRLIEVTPTPQEARAA